MTVYHWLVVAAIGLSLLMHGTQKGNIKYILLICALMFCVMGLRDCYTVGLDSTTSYLKSFNTIGDLDWNEITGKGEDNLNIATGYLFKLIYLLSNGDYQWVIITLAAFEMLVLAHFLRRYSISPVVSILCYFGLLLYTFMFSALKQSIAMAIIMLSFDAIVDRKPLRFLLLVVIAGQFHFPAFIFLPAYFISKMNTDKTYWFMLASLLLITFVFRNGIVHLMTDVYENNIYDTDMRFLANKVLVMLGIVGLAYAIHPPSAEESLYNLLLKLMGIAIVLQTFASYNNTFERLANYYFQFSIIFIPLIFQPESGHHVIQSRFNVPIITSWGPILICCFAIWRFLDSVQNSGGGFLPFYFYFNAPDPILMLWRCL